MTTDSRRLAAILAADVVAYSRLLAENEARTLDHLRALRRDIIDPLTSEHGGRIFKTTGDGLLAEFPSAVQALRCALAIQTRQQTDPAALQLRIGLHQGDVLIEGDDILGDGVNIAARIEPFAEAGGIAISARVREDALGKLDLQCDDLGEPPLKNIDRPVRVYRVRIPGNSNPALALPDKPSLAVLPFANLSGDPEQEYFADGVVEDIVTALSRVAWFFVIARNSSFIYKGRNIDVKQVGRELGVRYVLEGSIRKAGGRVRIAGQLVEAETGHHVWADRFDGKLEDIFDLQDQVAEHVVGAIEPNLLAAEIKRATAKPTESLTAYDLYLRALPHSNAHTKAGSETALGLLHRAIALDGNFVRAKAALADVYGTRVISGWANPGEAELGIAVAREAGLGGRDDPETLRIAGHMLALLSGETEQPFAWIQRALQLNPNSASVAMSAGYVHCFVGLPDPAAELLHRAIRLSPLDPEGTQMVAGIALTHLMAGKFDEALTWGLRSLRELPDWSPAVRFTIVAYVWLNRLEEARALAQHQLKIDPTFTVENRAMRYGDAKFLAAFKDALRAAGLPG